MKSSFESLAELAIQDGINAAIASIEGKPYTPKIEWPDQEFHILECLEDHTRRIDAGLGGISVPMKKGDIIEAQDLSIHSLDISKFKMIRTELRKA
jgi:hypothetical protein